MILLAIEDITKDKLIREKVILAAIVESSKDAIIGTSLDGIITNWNKGAEKIYGYTKSEIIGKSISVIDPPEIPDEMTNILRKVKLGEAISNYETVRQRKDGQDIYVFLTVSAARDDEGRILAHPQFTATSPSGSRLRKGDTVARFGGDEFLPISPCIRPSKQDGTDTISIKKPEDFIKYSKKLQAS